MRNQWWLYTAALVAASGAFSISANSQTFIRATLPNPSQQTATGYRFQILTPGNVLDGSVQTRNSHLASSDARLVEASLPSRPSGVIRAVRDTHASVSFPFSQPLPGNDPIDLRVAFTPTKYWNVYFQDVFQYADGHTEKSRIPYAAFFINYEPTKDPTKKKASLTIVNNVASSYGIPKSVVNDDARRPITFRNAQVFINNKMDHYDLQHFDKPDGQKVDLPATFTLKAGEAQTFDLGIVDTNSYVLTLSEVSYEGENESFPIACSHPPDNALQPKDPLQDDSDLKGNSN
jgi:hypothetical protein